MFVRTASGRRSRFATRLAVLFCLIALTAQSLAEPPKDEPPKANAPKAESPKAESPKIEVGAKAPDFSVTVIGSPARSLTLAQLAGKDVLLEFWATWCGPCIKTQDELVRLHEKFSDQGLQIVAISDESPDVIARYLKKRPVPYTAATDEKGLLQEAYGVQDLPRCVLIDKQGVVRWIGHPVVLKDAVLAEYFRSDKAPKSFSPPLTTTAPAESIPDLVLLIKIAQSRSKERLHRGIGFGLAPGRTFLIDQLDCRSQPLAAIFETLLQVSKSRLLVDPSDGDILYDVVFIHRPTKGDPSPKLLIDALLRETGLELQEVEEMRDVWVAAQPSREMVEVEDQRGESVPGGGYIIQRGQSVEELFRGLENTYGILIVDETRLAARYKFSASYDCQQSWGETRQYLEKEYGIPLKPDRRKVRLFTLRSTSDTSSKATATTQASPTAPATPPLVITCHVRQSAQKGSVDLCLDLSVTNQSSRTMSGLERLIDGRRDPGWMPLLIVCNGELVLHRPILMRGTVAAAGVEPGQTFERTVSLGTKYDLDAVTARGRTCIAAFCDLAPLSSMPPQPSMALLPLIEFDVAASEKDGATEYSVKPNTAQKPLSVMATVVTDGVPLEKTSSYLSIEVRNISRRPLAIERGSLPWMKSSHVYLLLDHPPIVMQSTTTPETASAEFEMVMPNGVLTGRIPLDRFVETSPSSRSSPVDLRSSRAVGIAALRVKVEEPNPSRVMGLPVCFEVERNADPEPIPNAGWPLVRSQCGAPVARQAGAGWWGSAP